MLEGERDVESHLEWREGRRKSEDGGSSMQSSRLDIRELRDMRCNRLTRN